MKGYNSIKEFVEDYKLYIAAKKIDPGKEGETITSYLKKTIDQKIAKASNNFKTMIIHKGYTSYDLKLIATHDSLRSLHNIESFLKECFGIRFAFIRSSNNMHLVSLTIKPLLLKINSKSYFIFSKVRS